MFIRRSTLSVLLFTLSVAVPASADFRLERRLALAPGGTFTLETFVGAVAVVGDSPSGVTVSVTSSRDDMERRVDFGFEEQPGRARVTATRVQSAAHWFRSWQSYGNLRFIVHVPSRTEVVVGTSGGEVHVSRLDGTARLRTSGGRVRVEDVAGEVIVRTSGGPITIDTTSGDVSADTSGGGIRVRGAGGRVKAHTSGGPIVVNFAPGNAQGGELSTSGGGVRAAVDPAAALSIDAATSGGGVSSDLALTTRTFSRNSIRGDLNGGGSSLRLRTSGGPIQISAAETR